MTEPLPDFVRTQSLAFSPAPSLPSSDRITNFPTGNEQAKDNWCWAAVISAIMVCCRHHDAMLNQHQIVRRMFNHERDEAAEFDSCLKRFRIQYVADIGSDILEPEVQANIVDHVTNGRPAAIQIHWRGGSSVGHVVCAFGVQQTSRGDAFWIYDPSGKDNDDDNEKLFPISEMTRYEDGLGKGTTGSWVAAFRITAP